MFKILVATDGSEHAYRAADFAARLAGKISDAEITALSVLDPAVVSQAAVSPAGIPVTIPVTLSEDLQRAMEEVLQDTQQRLLAPGRTVSTRLAHGKPALVIREIAEKEGFDLIVMGASGHGRIADILLGSVSDEVVHRSGVPVVIVRVKEERR